MRDLIRATKALSDETRLRILNVVMEQECCVCEVMQALEISQTRASRNLKVLYDAGFLKLRNEGLWSLYSLDTDGIDSSLTHLLEAVKKTLQDNPLAPQDKERLRKADRVGPNCAAKRS